MSSLVSRQHNHAAGGSSSGAYIPLSFHLGFAFAFVPIVFLKICIFKDGFTFPRLTVFRSAWNPDFLSYAKCVLGICRNSHWSCDSSKHFQPDTFPPTDIGSSKCIESRQTENPILQGARNTLRRDSRNEQLLPATVLSKCTLLSPSYGWGLDDGGIHYFDSSILFLQIQREKLPPVGTDCVSSRIYWGSAIAIDHTPFWKTKYYWILHRNGIRKIELASQMDGKVSVVHNFYSYGVLVYNMG